MAQIIPAINARNLAEIKEKLKLVEPYFEWAHLDVADGTFTPNVLWHEPAELCEIKTTLKIEAHLMLDDIDGKIAPWLARPEIARIIFHAETARDPSAAIAACVAAGKEVGLSIKPDMKWEMILPYAAKIDLVQILAVSPGKAGQDFDESALEKISAVRKSCPSCIIEVDGGMRIGTVKLAVQAGANIIVAASAIFGNKDIKQAIDTLKNDASA